MVPLTKDSMYADKPIQVANLPPVRFIGGAPKKGMKGNIKGSWDPEILVAVITTVGIPMEDSLADIGIKSRNMMIRLECAGKAYWVRSLV